MKSLLSLSLIILLLSTAIGTVEAKIYSFSDPNWQIDTYTYHYFDVGGGGGFIGSILLMKDDPFYVVRRSMLEINTPEEVNVTVDTGAGITSWPTMALTVAHYPSNCFGQWSFDLTIINGFDGGFAFCVGANSYDAEGSDWPEMDIQGYFIQFKETYYMDEANNLIRIGLLHSSSNPITSISPDQHFIELGVRYYEELGFNNNGLHHIEIQRTLQGNITVLLDYQQIFSIRELNYTRGEKMAFWSNHGHVQIDNVEDNSPSLPLFSPENPETWGISFLLLLILVIIRNRYKRRKERKEILSQEYLYME